MSSSQSNQNHGEQISSREQLDLLISRIADGEAGEHDWRDFSALAQAHPDAWKQLAQAQRQHGELSLAVGLALHAAERVELPSRSAGAALGGGATSDVHSGVGRIRAWGGWAVAAVVALAWLSGHQLGVVTPQQIGTPGTAGTGGTNGVIGANIGLANWTSDDYASAYLSKGQKEGRVFGELAARPIEIRPAANGQGYDVVFVRQIVERARVNDLMKFGVDEVGRPVPVKYDPPVRYAEPQ